MYYITEKNSETGKKFQEISNKRKLCWKAQKDFREKYGFKAHRGGYWVVFGGISSLVDPVETPDPKVWGKGAVKGEFMPKGNTKIGKAIRKEIDDLTTVSIDELNGCIGFKGYPFKTIGFAENDDSYFGFETEKKWDITVPEDCTEILESKYAELFRNK